MFREFDLPRAFVFRSFLNRDQIFLINNFLILSISDFLLSYLYEN